MFEIITIQSSKILFLVFIKMKRDLIKEEKKSIVSYSPSRLPAVQQIEFNLL